MTRSRDRRSCAWGVVVVVAMTLAGCSASDDSAPESTGGRTAVPVAVQQGLLTWAGASNDPEPARVMDAATALVRMGVTPPSGSGVARALREVERGHDARSSVAYARYLQATGGDAPNAHVSTGPDVPEELRLDAALLRHHGTARTTSGTCEHIAAALAADQLVDAAVLAVPEPSAGCAGEVAPADWRRLLTTVEVDTSAQGAAELRYLPHLADVLGRDLAPLDEEAAGVLTTLSESGSGLPVHVPLQQLLDLTGLLAGTSVRAPAVVASLEQTIASDGADADVVVLDSLGTALMLDLVAREDGDVPVRDLASRDPAAWLWLASPPPSGDPTDEELWHLVEHPGSRPCSTGSVEQVHRELEASTAGTSVGLPAPARLTVVARQVDLLRTCGADVPDLPFDAWESEMRRTALTAPPDMAVVLRWAAAESSCLRTGRPGDGHGTDPRPTAGDDVTTAYARVRLEELSTSCTPGWWSRST